jgi:hypothetical protein
MSRILNRRPSAALILSAIAVFMSFGGVSYGLASGSIGSTAVKDNALRSQDIRNNNLQGKDVRNNGLKGADVLESSLGTVPSAQTAQTAQTAQSAQSAQTAQSAAGAESVDGMNLAKIDYAVPDNTPLGDLVSLGGVTIEAACDGAGALTLNARSGVDNSMLHAVSHFGITPTYNEDDDFDAGQVVPLTSANVDSEQGSFTFAASNGSIVTGTYLVEEDPGALGSANDCFVKGTLVQG